MEAAGYTCLRDRVCVEAARAAIRGAECDYDAMGAYVRRVVRDVLGADATAAKYRVSDNDNADASVFHRDAIRAPCAPAFEVLTCIVYLDDAAMQVVPGSHVRAYGAMDALFAQPRATLLLRAGDVLVFHAELVHRAVLLPHGRRRRVIQIFDVVRCARHAARIAHVVSAGSSAAGYWVARAPVVAPIARLVGFIHAMGGYGAFDLGRDVTYLSSEGFSARVAGTGRQRRGPLGVYCALAPTRDVDRASIFTRVFLLPQLRIVATLAACAAVCAYVALCVARRFLAQAPPKKLRRERES